MGFGRNDPLDHYDRDVLDDVVFRFMRRNAGDWFSLREIRRRLERTHHRGLVRGVVGTVALNNSLERLLRRRLIRSLWDEDIEVYSFAVRRDRE